jgi:regulator of protease activity HflC (stomatin/prohibitin superfamily)
MLPRFITTSTTGVVQTFGRFSRTAEPGLNWYVPFFQTITPVSNRVRENTFQFEIKTKDDVFADLYVSVQYKILPEDTEQAFFRLDDPSEQMNSYIENVIRSEAPKMKLNDLYESQDDLSQSVKNTLAPRMKEFGYTIVKTLVKNIEPDSKVKQAMNQIYASERMKEAARNEAESNYILKVREAEADRDRKRLQGEGMSLQRLAILRGYETGIEDMAKKLGLTSRDIIDFVMKTQHLDAIEAVGTSKNTKTLFLNHIPQGMNKRSFKEDMMIANEAV